jgi:hypothetical protein
MQSFIEATDVIVLPYQLNDCDIIICQGKSWLSKKITWTQKLKGYPLPDRNSTHVAMVVKLDIHEVTKLIAINNTYILHDPDDLYVFETTTLNKWADKKGLQINPFGQWLANYNGTVGVRQLEFDRTETRRNLLRFITQHLADKKYSQYENGIMGGLELLMCVLGGSQSIIETNTIHCSEIIAECLKALFLIRSDSSVPKNSRMPPAMWNSKIDMYTQVPVEKMRILK